MATAAQRQAPRLPSGNGGKTPSPAMLVLIGLFTVFVMAVPVVLAVLTVLNVPWGWAAVLAGVLIWAAVSWLFRRIAPDQTVSSMAVDDAGTVRVLRGRGMIPAYRRMLQQDGIGRWFGRGIAIGLGLVVVAVAAAIVGAMTPLGVLPTLAITQAAFIAMGVMFYGIGGVVILARIRGMRILDARVVGPMLGLYAVEHGDRAALAGVPADRLLQAQDDAPREARERLQRLTFAVHLPGKMVGG